MKFFIIEEAMVGNVLFHAKAQRSKERKDSQCASNCFINGKFKAKSLRLCSFAPVFARNEAMRETKLRSKTQFELKKTPPLLTTIPSHTDQYHPSNFPIRATLSIQTT